MQPVGTRASERAGRSDPTPAAPAEARTPPGWPRHHGRFDAWPVNGAALVGVALSNSNGATPHCLTRRHAGNDAQSRRGIEEVAGPIRCPPEEFDGQLINLLSHRRNQIGHLT
ncbi:unnamed protein product [Lampetra fluviatilis]